MAQNVAWKRLCASRRGRRDDGRCPRRPAGEPPPAQRRFRETVYLSLRLLSRLSFSKSSATVKNRLASRARPCPCAPRATTAAWRSCRSRRARAPSASRRRAERADGPGRVSRYFASSARHPGRRTPGRSTAPRTGTCRCVRRAYRGRVPQTRAARVDALAVARRQRAEHERSFRASARALWSVDTRRIDEAREARLAENQVARERVHRVPRPVVQELAVRHGVEARAIEVAADHQKAVFAGGAGFRKAVLAFRTARKAQGWQVDARVVFPGQAAHGRRRALNARGRRGVARFARRVAARRDTRRHTFVSRERTPWRKRAPRRTPRRARRAGARGVCARDARAPQPPRTENTRACTTRRASRSGVAARFDARSEDWSVRRISTEHETRLSRNAHTKRRPCVAKNILPYPSPKCVGAFPPPRDASRERSPSCHDDVPYVSDT